MPVPELLIGFIVAYPMNWWLVANHLKHGMMTIRPAGTPAGAHDHDAEPDHRSQFKGNILDGAVGLSSDFYLR